MGVIESDSEDAQCVGVLLPVTKQEMKRFDRREQGYRRERLDLDKVDCVSFLDEEEHYPDEPSDPHLELFLKAKQQSLEAARLGIKTDAHDMIRIWVYIQENPIPPTEEFPIVQSYVDTIIQGCLQISKEFASEFILTTKGWSPEELDDILNQAGDDDDSDSDDENAPAGVTTDTDVDDEDDEIGGSSSDENTSSAHWVNDRHDPIYIRGDPEWSRKKGRHVDSLLREHIPDELEDRQVL